MCATLLLFWKKQRSKDYRGLLSSKLLTWLAHTVKILVSQILAEKSCLNQGFWKVMCFQNLAFKEDFTNYPQINLNENETFSIYAKTVNHKHNGQFCLPVYCNHDRLQISHIEKMCL